VDVQSVPRTLLVEVEALWISEAPMFRQTRLAAQAAGSEACVHDAPSADLVPLIPPKWRKKPPEPEPQAPEGRALLQDLRRDEADGALQEVRQRRGPHV
jgi:hypothetical protein